MPITQSRMIDLINAAADYQRGLEALIDFIHQQCQDGTSSASEALAAIQLMANQASLLKNPQASASRIALEIYHFHHNARRNDRVRLKRAKAADYQRGLTADRQPKAIHQPAEGSLSAPSLSAPLALDSILPSSTTPPNRKIVPHPIGATLTPAVKEEIERYLDQTQTQAEAQDEAQDEDNWLS